MTGAVTWGVVTTAKASAKDILRFAAHHLDAGATRIHVFLDDRNPKAFFALKEHPKCRVTVCDAAYWQRTLGARPDKIEPRQSANATRAYRMHSDLDWVLHADIDEFLVTRIPMAEVLQTLPDKIDTLRIRPMEALATPAGTPPTAFKDYMPVEARQIETTIAMYPTYGAYLRAGFLSHLGGKVFLRGGKDHIKIRIHNVFQNGQFLDREAERNDLRLAHFHATSWEDWRRSYAFRLAQGSYRQGLKAAPHEDIGSVSLNDLFTVLTEDDGIDGLRPFFDEVCADTPVLRARLAEQNLLVLQDLKLDEITANHFPAVKGSFTSV